jgi:helicase
MDEVGDFLEGSFGAFRQRQNAEAWKWDRTHLARVIAELKAHGLLEQTEQGGLLATDLGRLAGESGVQVESILRLVAALSPVQSNELTNATLIAAAQLTAELDEVLFPLNKSSKIQEPQRWAGELQTQRVAASVQRGLFNAVTDQHMPTLRAKKAVACLLWITDNPDGADRALPHPARARG